MAGQPGIARADLVFNGDTAEVELAGDLDLVAVPALSEEIDHAMDKQPKRLIFDMRAVTFLDVGVIRALAHAALCLPGLRKPVIRRPSAVVRKLLEISSFNAAFEYEE